MSRSSLTGSLRPLRLGISLATAFIALFGTHRADASCGDYLQTPEAAAEMTPRGMGVPLKAPADVPAGVTCRGGVCQPMPIPAGDLPFEIDLRGEGSSKLLWGRSGHRDGDRRGGGFLLPRDDDRPGSELVVRLDRPPRDELRLM